MHTHRKRAPTASVCQGVPRDVLSLPPSHHMHAGTEPFIAPEIADMSRGGAAVPASDLFSFGVTVVATLLPFVFRDRMPTATAGVMQVFAASPGDGDALASRLLARARGADVYGAAHGSALDHTMLFGLVKQLLAVDPAKRPTAEAAFEHPLFSSVQLHRAPAPTTPPIEVVGPGGTCRTYRIRHGGEVADTEATWESLHFNEGATQFYLMLGKGKLGNWRTPTGSRKAGPMLIHTLMLVCLTTPTPRGVLVRCSESEQSRPNCRSLLPSAIGLQGASAAPTWTRCWSARTRRPRSGSRRNAPHCSPPGSRQTRSGCSTGRRPRCVVGLNHPVGRGCFWSGCFVGVESLRGMTNTDSGRVLRHSLRPAAGCARPHVQPTHTSLRAGE